MSLILWVQLCVLHSNTEEYLYRVAILWSTRCSRGLCAIFTNYWLVMLRISFQVSGFAVHFCDAKVSVCAMNSLLRTLLPIPYFTGLLSFCTLSNYRVFVCRIISSDFVSKFGLRIICRLELAPALSIGASSTSIGGLMCALRSLVNLRIIMA